MPAAPEGATWTSPPREVDRVHFRRDRRGFLETGATHLFVVPATGGTARQLTDGEGTVGQLFAGVAAGASLSWTLDGSAIVFEGLLEEDWEERYRESHIYAVDVESGAIRRITQEKGPWSGPRLSPDGRLVAFTGYPWSRQTYRAADLYVIGLDGSNMRKISGDLDRSPQSLHWAQDGSGIFFTAQDRGSSNVHFASLDGSVRPITDGTHMLSLNSLSADGRAGGVLRSATEPGDVVAYSLSSFAGFQKLTAVPSSFTFMADPTPCTTSVSTSSSRRSPRTTTSCCIPTRAGARDTERTSETRSTTGTRAWTTTTSWPA
jgi:Tol biopolymer transport system component